tara:strand:- start:143 stop:514 length:372 start_codon:yes stop_codon:yes gene_type:complete
MELELKHLAPYLPYGLKARFMHPVVKHQKTGVINNTYNLDDDVKLSIDYSDDEHIWMYKPILRPLSDLTEYSYTIGSYFNLEDFKTCVYNKEVSVLEWEDLLKNHFDVFGLIEKGLAIDINTL